jgi:glucans biosynthesis protein C
MLLDSDSEARSRPARLHHIDSIRVVLSALVVLHHAAQPYGPFDWWYVEDQPKAPWIENFAVLNASFTMSLFFVIAAYFLPAAVDRRHRRPFVGPRLRKLGGPILVGFFLVIPVLMYAYYLNHRGYGHIGFGDYFWNIYLGEGTEPADWSGPIWPDRQFGHLWFIQHLLVYSLMYLAWRAVADRVRTMRGRPPSPGASSTSRRVGGPPVFGFAIVVAVGTALLRIRYPVDEWVPVAEIIQTEPADLAQQFPFVIAGVMAYRRGWLQGLSARVAYGWMAAAVALSVIYVVFRDALVPFVQFGGANAGQFVWAGYETVLCVGYVLGSLAFFRDHVRGTSRLQRSASDATFAIYLLHLPIVVALQYAARHTPLGASGRFFAVAVLGFILSVTAALLLRRTPIIRSIL